MQIIKQLIWGFAFGVANIIPGVSGGTFALVLGFYDRLLKALEGLNGHNIKAMLQIILSFPKNQSQSRKDFKKLAHQLDLFFLSLLGVGALISIFCLSALMKYLLVNQFEPTYGYFFGLITLSFVVPWKLIQVKSIKVYLMLILGIVLTVGVTLGVDPVQKAETKSELYQQRLNESGEKVVTTQGSTYFSWQSKYTGKEYLMVGASGAIAISAMVLPGISGSLILILLGQYMLVIQAISQLRKLYLDDIVFLGLMSVGMLVGLKVTAKLVTIALDKLHDETMGFLSGLILGSLFVLYPFRGAVTKDLYVKVDGVVELKKAVTIYTNELLLPNWSLESVITLLMIGLGLLSMVFFLKNDPEA